MTATVSRRRRFTGLALVLAAALSAAGCGTVSAGAAAVADDRRVSVGALQNATTQIQDIAGPDAQISQLQVLDWLLVEPWAVDIAAKYGVGVSTDDAVQLIRTASPAYDPNSKTTPHKVASAETIGAIRAMIALRHIQGQGVQLSQDVVLQATSELQAKVKTANIDVNPRYMGAPMDWLSGSDAATAGAGDGAGDGSSGGSGDGTGDGSGGTGDGSGGQAPQPTATP